MDIANLAGEGMSEEQKALVERHGLKELSAAIEDLLTRNISWSDLGPANGFLEAEETKNHLCAELQEVMSSMIETVGFVDEIVLKRIRNSIQNAITQMNRTATEIHNLAKQGVHDPHYPNNRKKKLTEFSSLADEARGQLINQLPHLEVAKLKISQEHLLSDKVRQETSSAVEFLKDKKAEVEKILENLRAEIGAESATTGESKFGSLADQYSVREWWWFGGSIVAAIGLIVAIIYSVNTELLENSSAQLVAFESFKRILIISTAAIFLRICLTKYDAERHLRIIYDHRKSVLSQYLVFENSIPEGEHDAKHSLRLEMSKVLFSDPQTAFSGTGSKSEININPIASAAESVLKKGVG